MTKQQFFIPSGWDFLPISNLGKVIGGGTPDTKNDDYWNGEILWATPTDITQLNGKYITNTQRKISKLGLQKSSAKLLPINSLLMTSRATIGSCAINLKEICTNQGFQNIIPNEKIDIEFLYYMIHSYKVQAKLIRNAYGSTFLEIPNKSVKKIKILVPSIKEQSLIASFFSNVDELIYITQHLIEKLQILKKGLMQRLFTEGTGHTEFKETRLGKIPKEWKIIQFQELILKIKRGESKKTNFEGKGVLYLTSDYIQDNKIVWENKKYLETEKDIGPYLLEEDDIIINCVNSFAKVGKVALFRSYYEPVVIGFNNFAVKVNLDLLDPNYLVYYFNSEKGYKEIIRTTKPAINQVSFSSKDVNIFKIILPPLNEQKKISSTFLIIDNKIENEIIYQNKLKEIKKGLMQNLLTGKKSVKIN